MVRRCVRRHRVCAAKDIVFVAAKTKIDLHAFHLVVSNEPLISNSYMYMYSVHMLQLKRSGVICNPL